VAMCLTFPGQYVGPLFHTQFLLIFAQGAFASSTWRCTNPDEIDNYEITRGLPTCICTREDPEVIDEMKWAKEDTANAGANDDSENEVAESDRMASDDEGGWVDEDADGVTSELSATRGRRLHRHDR